MPSGKRRRRRVTGKQRDKNFVEKKAEPQHEKTCDAPDEQEAAAAIMANDWFLSTLDGMMGLVAPPDHIEVPVVPIAPYPHAVVKTGAVVRYVSDNYWKLRVPKHLAELPRMKGVIQDIMAEPALKLDLLPSQTLASKILERAHIVIRGLPDNCCFKI
ncbi:cpt, partial [Symbiodinium sp. KB8]